MSDKPLELSDFGESDGIRECENTIELAGGSISKDFFITLPEPFEGELRVEACRAADYLVSEWDYAFEEWRSKL